MHNYTDVIIDKNLTPNSKLLFIYIYENYFNPSKKVKQYGTYREIDKQQIMKDLNICEITYDFCLKQLEKDYINTKSKPYIVYKKIVYKKEF